MAYDDLRDWIKTLDKLKEINYIKHEVDSILEMAEIADRVSKSAPPACAAGGPALMFENVKGYPGAKVLMNQFGSERRMCLALGVDSLSEVADRIRELMNLRSPEGFLDKVRMLPMLAEMGKFFPKLVSAKDAPCKQVILREGFSVLDFPILQCWPQDGGRFITLPCVITRDPRSSAGKRNVGMYRMQVYDGQTTGMHWQRQKVAAEHYRERLRQSAEDFPVSYVQIEETRGLSIMATMTTNPTTEPVKAPPVTLTPEAIKKVREIMATQDPVPAGLRLGVVGGGCSGFQYSMSFENQSGMMDKVLNFDDLKVFVDSTSLMYLSGCVVDYVETLEAAGFKFENPNVKSTCGCGSSFSA